MCLVIASPAWADPADDLVNQGQQLAKQGKLREAITKFRAAEAIHPRALHDCLIGLAFARAGQLSASEIAFATCLQRATPDDPLPPWVATEKTALTAKLDTSAFGTVELALAPPLETVQIAAVDPDPFVPPRSFHVAVGSHVVIARTKDGREARQTVEVVAGKPTAVTLELAAEHEQAPAPKEELPPPRTHARGRHTLFLYAGAGALVAGGLVHALVVYPAYKDLKNAQTDADYDDNYPRYNAGRITSAGLYLVGAALVGTGLVLRARDRDAPVVGARIEHGSALLTVEWQR